MSGSAEEHEPGRASTRRDPASKSDHISACLDDAVEYRRSTGLEEVEFVNQALPEVSLGQLDLAVAFLGRELRAPLMISPMTGGTERGSAINAVLGAAAERWGLAMGVGSQRVALEDPERARHFSIRDHAPTTVVFANLGGAQLVAGWGADEARRAVEMVRADALFIHLNPVQEAIQGGDQDFRGLALRLSRLCRALEADGVPVLAREVGFGISREAARRLIDAGVAGIDCAGAGGTSWARVESAVARDPRRATLGAKFAEWGIPTADAIRNVRAESARIPLIASGGIRDGIDVAKALALGADLASMARPFLVAADAGPEAVDALIASTLDELRVCMFGTGAPDLAGLRGRISGSV